MISNEMTGLKDASQAWSVILTVFSKRSIVSQEQSSATARRAGRTIDFSWFMTREITILAGSRMGSVPSPAGQSTFSTCSLAFSNSSFIITTDFWMVASLALDPVVLISRPISCRTKESFLPLLSPASSSSDMK